MIDIIYLSLYERLPWLKTIVDNPDILSGVHFMSLSRYVEDACVHSAFHYILDDNSLFYSSISFVMKDGSILYDAAALPDSGQPDNIRGESIIDAVERLSIDITNIEWVVVTAYSRERDSKEEKGILAYYIDSPSDFLLLKEMEMNIAKYMDSDDDDDDSNNCENCTDCGLCDH